MVEWKLIPLFSNLKMCSQESMDKILSWFMILKIKEDRNVPWDMTSLFHSVDLWLWTPILPKLRDFTSVKFTEEISQSWPREGTDNSINAILILQEPMILWSQMLKFLLLCKKFYKLSMSKNFMWKSITEKFFKQWFTKPVAEWKISKRFAVPLISWISSLGQRSKTSLLRLKVSLKSKPTSLVNSPNTKDLHSNYLRRSEVKMFSKRILKISIQYLTIFKSYSHT